MSLIEIPARGMLDAMLDELQLPRSICKTTVRTDGHMTVTVSFHPSTHALQQGHDLKIFTSCPQANMRAAEYQAVIQAVEYMECFEAKVLRDINYSRVKREQRSNQYLQSQIVEKDTQIKQLTSKLQQMQISNTDLLQEVAKKNKEIKQLTVCWDTFITNVCGPGERISKIVRSNYSEKECSLGCNLKSVLTEIDKAASDLQDFTIRAGKEIQEVCSYPYGIDLDSARDDQFHSSCGSTPPYIKEGSTNVRFVDETDK